MYTTTISAATLLALVSAVSAQTAGFDAITKPTKDEAVAACSTYTVTWDYTTAYPGTVSIQLLEGASPTTLQLGAVIASGVDNSAGQYSWAVDCSLGADATYGLKITWDSDSTGATFQYSNPFQITKSSTSSSSSSTAVAATTAPTTSSAAVNQNEVPESTLYSTEFVTITSCAATVTDCPARSTVVSSTVKPIVSTSALTSPTGGAATTPAASVPVSQTTLAPVYPAGNNTATANGNIGTVTLPKTSTTGSGSTPSSTTIVTAGAGRVATGSFALVAGAVVALFAL